MTITDILKYAAVVLVAGTLPALWFGVVYAGEIKGGCRRLRGLLPLTRRHTGHHLEPVPEHPYYGPLLDTPPGGITIVRGDGAISVKADRPVQRVRAAGDPFTGPMPKLTEQAIRERLAASEQDRLRFLDAHFAEHAGEYLSMRPDLAMAAMRGAATALGVMGRPRALPAVTGSPGGRTGSTAPQAVHVTAPQPVADEVMAP